MKHVVLNIVTLIKLAKCKPFQLVIIGTLASLTYQNSKLLPEELEYWDICLHLGLDVGLLE